MLRSIHCKIARPVVRCVARTQATATATNLAQLDLYNPTDEHASLRTMLREFVEKEVDPQALEFNRKEKFNVELFRKLGNLGLLGITVEPEFGGSGMDATAAVIAHGVYLSTCTFLLSWSTSPRFFLQRSSPRQTLLSACLTWPTACSS
jgi:alkylation response protein AidB-like acyl-CoA dehydrogenase